MKKPPLMCQHQRRQRGDTPLKNDLLIAYHKKEDLSMYDDIELMANTLCTLADLALYHSADDNPNHRDTILICIQDKAKQLHDAVLNLAQNGGMRDGVDS